MDVVFKDTQFSFQTLRLLGAAALGQTDVGECLATARRIDEGNFESWTNAWLATAQRIHASAERCARAGRTVSAREAYMRAASYYRAAEFFLHENPADPRIREYYTANMECFRQAIERLPQPPEPARIPYLETTLPGWFYKAEANGYPQATLLLQTGFDGSIEELHGHAVAATKRGMNCLTFEGPGQGQVIRFQGLPFRPDWEFVVEAVVDYALTRPEVDPQRIALEGISFGGYLAPRAAAFESRLAACIANGGVFDFMGSKLPADIPRAEFVAWLKAHKASYNDEAKVIMANDTDARWGLANGMFTFHAESPADWMLKAMDYELSNVAGQIACPMLVIDGEEEHAFPGQAQRLYDALQCPKTFMLFTRNEGAGDHCQVGAPLLAQQRIYDWLQETLQNERVA
ncbi:hypothetical protein CAI21_09895 [Alkalilimnicola ehrlichii]|uniref:Peptidase S9 prolyl oligopeptidase catalytic domain-containing protein n=1 Tax=Alkalilimnicola ehrlichii TaxID=351052 RepID=A0A3E0WV68_9GAMM|nr:alpha/beta fold hydrolase [Alkalilimnicola ehrlichii]RFA29369.1 hypothetical protein CAI21_09895 [Alkalilimnicola ehrlichii]RFA36882.1 hypothetical protein CAL65_10225 [Alkalilimnicola ehrlichii]